MNVVMVIMVWAIPKRNVFFGCLVSSSLTVVLSSDTIWKCSFVLVGGKLVAFVMVVVFLAGARKLAARLSTGGASGASLLTQTQKTCSCGVVLNSVGLLATPDSSILAVVEILLWIGVLAESWVHFVAFEHSQRHFWAGGKCSCSKRAIRCVTTAAGKCPATSSPD